MKLKWLIYPLRIFYVLFIVVFACSVPILGVAMFLTPILDIFYYISTGRIRLTETYCNWYFGKYPEYYLNYLKPENILERIENKHKQ